MHEIPTRNSQCSVDDDILHLSSHKIRISVLLPALAVRTVMAVVQGGGDMQTWRPQWPWQPSQPMPSLPTMETEEKMQDSAPGFLQRYDDGCKKFADDVDISRTRMRLLPCSPKGWTRWGSCSSPEAETGGQEAPGGGGRGDGRWRGSSPGTRCWRWTRCPGQSFCCQVWTTRPGHLIDPIDCKTRFTKLTGPAKLNVLWGQRF